MTVKQLPCFTGNLTVKHPGSTLHGMSPRPEQSHPPSGLEPFEEGFLLGILTGEGHFGGDGRQPQVTLRMHTRHEKLFTWMRRLVPGSRLYGPYHHGGRHYYQWMARGSVLREILWPILLRRLAFLDDHVQQRVAAMAEAYDLPMAPLP
jgi:hypothetical protein